MPTFGCDRAEYKKTTEPAMLGARQNIMQKGLQNIRQEDRRIVDSRAGMELYRRTFQILYRKTANQNISTFNINKQPLMPSVSIV
jgi:hypothetical protein